MKNVGEEGGGDRTADEIEMIEISLRKMIGLTQLLLYVGFDFV